MEKIIVREKVLDRGQANSSYINLCNDIEYDSVEMFLQDYSYKTSLNIWRGNKLRTIRKIISISFVSLNTGKS